MCLTTMWTCHATTLVQFVSVRLAPWLNAYSHCGCGYIHTMDTTVQLHNSIVNCSIQLFIITLPIMIIIIIIIVITMYDIPYLLSA